MALLLVPVEEPTELLLSPVSRTKPIAKVMNDVHHLFSLSLCEQVQCAVTSETNGPADEPACRSVFRLERRKQFLDYFRVHRAQSIHCPMASVLEGRVQIASVASQRVERIDVT